MLWECHAAAPGWLGVYRAAVPATRPNTAEQGRKPNTTCQATGFIHVNKTTFDLRFFCCLSRQNHSVMSRTPYLSITLIVNLGVFMRNLVWISWTHFLKMSRPSSRLRFGSSGIDHMMSIEACWPWTLFFGLSAFIFWCILRDEKTLPET